MRKILIAVMAMVTFLVMITAPLAFAAIWDVQDDFSITNNPTDAWSYGWESAPGGTFNLYTHVAVGGFYDGYAPAWYDTINFYGWITPSVWQNLTTGVVWFHPGPSPIDAYPSSSGKYSVVRWTSPVSGSITINGMFGAGHPGYLKSFFIYNGTTSLFEVHGTLSDAPFSLTKSISIGDTIDFMNGEYHWGGAAPLYATIEYVPAFSCVGYEPPLDKGPVKVMRNRVLPLKADILDGVTPIINTDLSAPPIIHVMFKPVTGSAVDVTSEALPEGQGTNGNQFEITGGKWQYNLQTKNYNATGTYTVTMQAGDGSYNISPTCTAIFVIE